MYLWRVRLQCFTMTSAKRRRSRASVAQSISSVGRGRNVPPPREALRLLGGGPIRSLPNYCTRQGDGSKRTGRVANERPQLGIGHSMRDDPGRLCLLFLGGRSEESS